MKNKILSLLICLIVVLTITGCGNKQNNSTNTATGVNTNNNTTEKVYSPSELSKNIVSSGAVSDLGKLIVIAKNNNKVAVDLEIEVEFYDADNNIVGSDTKSLNAIGKNAEIATEMWSTPDSFDNYKIFIDAEQTTEISYFDKIELTHNNNGKEIVVQVKNNSEDIIDYTSVSVVYFQGEKIVGIDNNIDSDIKPGRSANFTLNYPYNKNYDDINFDNYKVYITEAYSYNW